MTLLTLKTLKYEASLFSLIQSQHRESSLYGVNDGKSIGTHIERRFQNHLTSKEYKFEAGSAASGIDLPSLNVDIKVTSTRQPQSSCPFRSARQKIYGLGYHILLFVYQKLDDLETQTSILNINKTVFINRERTADYQLTFALGVILKNNGNVDDVFACLMDRNLPVDEMEARLLAEEVCANPPSQGLLTISNALQWRLQYTRAISLSNREVGLECLHSQ